MKYLSDYIESEVSKLKVQYNFFYAFSNRQFNELKDDGVEYVQCFKNAFCPKEKAEKLLIEMNIAVKRAVLKDIQENTAKGIAKREYFNHEAHLDGSNSWIKDGLLLHKKYSDLFTEELLNEVKKECFAEAIHFDYF